MDEYGDENYSCSGMPEYAPQDTRRETAGYYIVIFLIATGVIITALALLKII